MKKNKNTLLKIIIILFLSFIFGIWTGSVSANINTPWEYPKVCVNLQTDVR